MDPVSNANRLAMLLRQRLDERSRAGPAARAGRKEAKGTGDVAGRDAMRGADAVEALDDRKLKRVMIEHILVDQFGPALVNDASFQQLVDQVTEAIEADKNGALTLSQALAEVRARP
jgi:hypothetical protein